LLATVPKQRHADFQFGNFSAPRSLTQRPHKSSAIFSRSENAVIKTVVTSFIRDQSGAAEFDGMTVFLLAVVFPISMYFMYSTFGGVYLAIFDWLGTAASR
jgi:hypothetical protein